jgi:NADPH2:quinone reductase
MLAHVQHAFGGPDTLKLEQLPEPTCPDDGYLVATRAVGVNFADVVQRRGRYSKDQPLPQVLGKEASGVVTARGPDATRFAPGDAVIVLAFDGGCYAETLAVREDQLLAPPAGLGFVELAAFAGTFLTAWYALREVARVRPGESVLVQAAAGGVGSAAVALAHAMGCAPVLGTAGSPAKCDHVLTQGADVAIDYRAEDFRHVVRAHTRGRGVDVCLESVGGEVYERSLEVMAPLGRVVILGFSSVERDHGQRVPRLHPLRLLHGNLTVGGLDVDALAVNTRPREWSELNAFCAEHGLRPQVGATFPFEQAAAAHAALEGRQTTGKVVLVLDGADEAPVLPPTR